MRRTGQDARAARRRRRGRIFSVVALIAAVAFLGVSVVVLRAHLGRLDAGPSTTPSPSTSPTPTASPTPEPGADIAGPLNLLLVGVDTRVSVPGWQPHADAVLVMHVTRDLTHAYLFALPRDLLVNIPAFKKAKFAGERTKLTHAMSYGSRVPGKPKSPSTAQGYELLATTVSRYTGIQRFDAGAVITFQGFDKLVDALGGVDLYVDQRVPSIHRRPDGRYRQKSGSGEYVGPQMVYNKGNRHLNGWQALDYARQRYIDGGAYARQRHQQQLIKAIVGKIFSQDLTRDQARLDEVLRALGRTLTFAGGGQRVVDFAYALSGLRADAITLVALPGHGVGSGNGYRGEDLDKVGRQFLAQLRTDAVDEFLADHPKLLIRDAPNQ